MIFRRGLTDYRMYEDDQGREAYRYTGQYYALDMPEDRRRAVQWGLLAASVCAAGLTFLTGKLAGTAFLRLYAVIPFLFAVFFAGWGLTGALNLAVQKNRMTLNQFTISFKRLKRCMAGLAASMGVTAGAMAISGAANGVSLLPAALTAAAAGGVFLYIHKKICICILDQSPEN